MRMPKGVSPASGRAAMGLPCPQQKIKVLSKTDLLGTVLSSPPINTVPVGYFTQICNTTAAEQRANSLYSTPHGPEAKPIRSSSGRLPVKNQTHTHTLLLLLQQQAYTYIYTYFNNELLGVCVQHSRDCVFVWAK